MGKLKSLAEFLEALRSGVGPLEIHSGGRCPVLNRSVGSSERSQHLLCEAADSSRPGPDNIKSVEELFNDTLEHVVSKGIMFGQLILEQGDRFGRSAWMHTSLGYPWRARERCGQVLRAKPGPDGKMVYTMLKQLAL